MDFFKDQTSIFRDIFKDIFLGQNLDLYTLSRDKLGFLKRYFQRSNVDFVSKVFPGTNMHFSRTRRGFLRKLFLRTNVNFIRTRRGFLRNLFKNQT